MLGGQISQAASAAVSAAAENAAASEATAKLDITLHAPVLVLPSSSADGGALLLRLGERTGLDLTAALCCCASVNLTLS
jgi:hypothetical protein